MKSFITATVLIALASAHNHRMMYNQYKSAGDKFNEAKKAKAVAFACAKKQIKAKAECVTKYSVEAAGVTCKAKYTSDAIKATCAAQDPKVATCSKD